MRMDDIGNVDLDAALRADREKYAGTYGFKLTRLGDLEVKAPEWIIRDLIERDSLIAIFGDPSAGKTFLEVDFLACTATGTPFHGYPVKDPGPVVLILGEGLNGIARRFRAWSLDRGVDLAAAPIFISSGPVALCEPDLMARVESAIEECSKVYGTPRIVAFDTWGRLLGGDESSAQDAGLGIQALDRIRGRTGAAILVIHHSGNVEKGRARGSSAFRGAMDSEIQAVRGQDGTVRLAWTKAKDTRPPEPLAFKLVDVDLGLRDSDGRAIQSAALHRVEFQEDRAPRALGTNQAAALDTLRKLVREYAANLARDGREPGDGRVRLEDWKAALRFAGIPRQRVYELVGSLQAAGRIELIGGEWVRIP